MASGQEQLAATLKTIADKPVKYVLNSNGDPYNHQGNEFWAKKGAMIISHENIQYAPSYFQLLFQQKLSLEFGGERILAYRAPSHSLGHINIYLQDSWWLNYIKPVKRLRMK